MSNKEVVCMNLKIPMNWAEVLQDELQKPYIRSLKEALDKEKSQGKIIYPHENNVFHALRLTPFEEVKVVIMGQDPYHGPNQAMGLSFSVQKERKIPPSLQNIYKELQSDLGLSIPSHGDLTSWAQQGVLMLNATLTVRHKEPRSHYGLGWEIFTDAIIEQLMTRKDPIAFILWGRSAKEKVERFLSQRQHPHFVLTSAHPSPYSATKFFGTRPFSQVNQFLQSVGKKPIDWMIQ